jgi:adenylate kinase
VIVVFLGAPGSGKGTQAKLLAEELNVPHIALGDLLREEISQETPLGKEIKGYVNNGRLAPDFLVNKVAEERLNKINLDKGVALDGYPRSLNQAEALDKILQSKKYMVVNFDVPLEEIVTRNSGRLSCSSCGAVFHIKFNPPKTSNKCDLCGGKLYQRKDDTPELISERYKIYMEKTTPVIEFYKKLKKYFSVDGRGDIQAVFGRLKKLLSV